MPWRPGQEEREVGRSYASGRVWKKNKVYAHSVTKASENKIFLKKGLGPIYVGPGNRPAAGLLFSRQANHTFNMKRLRKEIDHVDFFHVIARFQKQARIAR